MNQFTCLDPTPHGACGDCAGCLRLALKELDRAFYEWRQRAYEVCPELLTTHMRPEGDR